MANFVASTFISSYLSSSLTLRIVNSAGKIVTSLNVCNYQKALVVDANLSVVLEDNTKEYVFDFSSNSEAITALGLFKSAIDALRPNCTQIPQGGGATASPVPIVITYDNYKTAAAGSSLLPLQWYDINDSNGEILVSGTTIRALATTTSDSHPRGFVYDSTKANISINTTDSSVPFYELPLSKTTLLNCLPTNLTIDNLSYDIVGMNASVITVVNSSKLNIYNSTASLNSCSAMSIRNSVVTVSNATNVTIDNIQQDLTTLGFNLSNVEINRNMSWGLVGRDELNVGSGAVTLESYRNSIEENITLNTSSNTATLTLDNKILQANAEFRIRYVGTGTNNVITILNNSATTLFTLNDSYKNSWVVFRFNKATHLFEFVSVLAGGAGANAGGTEYYVSPVTNNQTSFPLPIPAIQPTSLAMFINGQKKVYGLDFTYASSGNMVTYLNRDFAISSTDEVEFVIF